MSDDLFVERASTNGGATGASLEELLTFERLLADLSARFANVSIVQVETEIDSALNHLQEFLGFDRSNFYEFTADGWATIIGSAARAGVERLPLGPAPAVLRWYLGQVRAGKVMRVQSIEDYSPEAIEQIAYHRRIGIRSSLGTSAPCQRPRRRRHNLCVVPFDAELARRPHCAAETLRGSNGSGTHAKACRNRASGKRRAMALNVRGVKSGHRGVR